MTKFSNWVQTRPQIHYADSGRIFVNWDDDLCVFVFNDDGTFRMSGVPRRLPSVEFQWWAKWFFVSLDWSTPSPESVQESLNFYFNECSQTQD